MAVTNQDWLDAQYSVLGSALIEPELVPKVIAETSPKDYTGACRNVYGAMRKLFLSGSPVDVVAVRAAMGENYTNFLVKLMDITPTAKNLDSYIHFCRERARILTVQEFAKQMVETSDMEELRALLEEASGMMTDRTNLRISTMSDALHSFMDRHSKGQTNYIPWPVRELNDCLYAEPGDFLIFAGYPSAGKSAWALQCAWHWAKNYKVGFFSLETSSEKLFDRQMASVAGISMDSIKRNAISDGEWDHLCSMTDAITTQNLELIPAAGMGPADVRAVTMMRGYQIVIIDYLQLLNGVGGNRTEQVSGISMALHTMAQSMGVTVVALSQMKRKPVGSDAPPDMSDLRESGQIEQDADVVMILSLEKKDDPGGNRLLKIAKNKEGTIARILLAFDGKHQTFSKAKHTGDVVSKYSNDAKMAQRQRRVKNQQADVQMTMLPDDTYVPFKE